MKDVVSGGRVGQTELTSDVVKGNAKVGKNDFGFVVEKNANDSIVENSTHTKFFGKVDPFFEVFVVRETRKRVVNATQTF